MVFRSGLEKRIAKALKRKEVSFKYEPKDGKIVYHTPPKKHLYTPDFYIITKTGKTVIIEAKGIWCYSDRMKHLLIRQQHPKLDIRFIFTNPNARIRKGSKTTYADVCNGKGRAQFKDVKWQYAKETIPKTWLEE